MISVRNYLTILILIIMIFIMFMFSGVSTKLLEDKPRNEQAEDKVLSSQENCVTADSLNLDLQNTYTNNSERTGRKLSNLEKKRKVAIVTDNTNDSSTKIFIEWCVYNKYLYRVYDSLPVTATITDFDVILFGNIEIGETEFDLLDSYSDIGKTMIFTKLPDYQEIKNDSRMKAFFGIKEAVSPTVTADGIKIFSGFMINKERIYEKGDYFGENDDTTISIPYYSLAPGYEVYAVGIFEDQKERRIRSENLPPLLWRTATKKSYVFVVNCDIFEGESMLGILTAFLSHESECYLYPVINAQTISLLSYPYFSNENNENIEQIYSRSSEAISRDLLWPNIVQVLKNFGSSYNFFAAPQLDYLDKTDPKEDLINFYLEKIHELPGVMGLSLDQKSRSSLEDIIARNKAFFLKYLPDYDVTALYSAEFDPEELRKQLKDDFLKNVSLVMSDYKEGDSLLGFLNNTVLSVKFNLNGYRHETKDDLQMSCLENALGMSNSEVDIKQVIYPENSKEQWNHLSLQWSRGKTYYSDYSVFDLVSIYEMENRVRRFLELDYSYDYDGNSIDIHIDHFNKEAYFILSLYGKKIDAVGNASSQAISDGAYLIKATAKDVHINLKEENVLNKPDNQSVNLSNPE